MKKLLILIPVSLLAISSATILSLEYNKPDSKVVYSSYASKNPADIFATNEHLLRQILRYGDTQSLENFHQSLNQLDGFLAPYNKKGFDTAKTDALVLQYVQDSIKVTQKAPAYMEKLKSSDRYERSNEKRFLASLDQIGLYELKDAFANLEKVRLEFIKTPTAESADKYVMLSAEVKNIIAELYLDTTIEAPLFAYIDNHRLYFNTVSAMYDAIGVEKIERLRSNSYAIKTELQLLPKL